MNCPAEVQGERGKAHARLKVAETDFQLSRNARYVPPRQALLGRDAMYQPGHQVTAQRQHLFWGITWFERVRLIHHGSKRALLIRTGFGGIVYYTYNQEPTLAPVRPASCGS